MILTSKAVRVETFKNKCVFSRIFQGNLSSLSDDKNDQDISVLSANGSKSKLSLYLCHVCVCMTAGCILFPSVLGQFEFQEPRPGFELGSLGSFPTKIINTPRVFPSNYKSDTIKIDLNFLNFYISKTIILIQYDNIDCIGDIIQYDSGDFIGNAVIIIVSELGYPSSSP